ncbi:hypothetical protein CRUP_032297 [Coryphaenoides rupestris]|nr:hypothetical protein CRUP_032297 [Coryphaenoides rupestris]
MEAHGCCAEIRTGTFYCPSLGARRKPFTDGHGYRRRACTQSYILQGGQHNALPNNLVSSQLHLVMHQLNQGYTQLAWQHNHVQWLKQVLNELLHQQQQQQQQTAASSSSSITSFPGLSRPRPRTGFNLPEVTTWVFDSSPQATHTVQRHQHHRNKGPNKNPGDQESDSANSTAEFVQQRALQPRQKDQNQSLLDKLTQEKLSNKSKPGSKPSDLSSVIHLDQALARMREYERMKLEAEFNRRNANSASAESSDASHTEQASIGPHSDEVWCPQIDAQHLDRQIKAIMTEVVPFLQEQRILPVVIVGLQDIPAAKLKMSRLSTLDLVMMQPWLLWFPPRMK